MMTTDAHALTLAGSPFGIAAGFLYGYQSTPAFEFMPRIRRLGAGFTKVYLFWNQIEPEKGRYDWTAVDRLLDQLESPDEALIALFSSSSWATRRPSAVLPPSPAIDPDDYFRFVRDLVAHCRGRVRYWQNDAEPNNPVYWSGTAAEFVDALTVFHRAVQTADPSAVVVVGGYDGLFGPPGARQFPNQQAGLDFFDHVLDAGRHAFDFFDLRLYGDPYTIIGRVDVMRDKMRALGYEKPIVCTEYGGPAFFQFPDNRQYLDLVHAWMRALTTTDAGGSGASADAVKHAVRLLYDRMSSLPPQTQMFMQGCAPDLDAKYQRLQARGIVIRNVLALAAGVQKTLYWALPAWPLDGDERFDLMALMYGKIGMLDLRRDAGDDETSSLTAGAFARLARALDGVRRVRRIEMPQPEIFLFEASCAGRAPMFIVWARRDGWSGEDEPAVDVAIEIVPAAAGVTTGGIRATDAADASHPTGTIDVMDAIDAPDAIDAIDALGEHVPMRLEHGRVRLAVSVTPIFIDIGAAASAAPLSA